MMKRTLGRLALSVALCLLASAAYAAPSFEILYRFHGNDGRVPTGGPLIQDRAGNLYGTTRSGGTYDLGTVYRLAPDGTETVLHSFGADGDAKGPITGVIADKFGNLYGTTGGYAFGGNGSVYKITPDENETVLHTFWSASEGYPPGPLLIDHKGNLYGVTIWGGNSNCLNGCGTIFRIKPNGKMSTIYTFDGSQTAYPAGTLIADEAGNLHGTTVATGGNGPTYGHASVFELPLAGSLSLVHKFTPDSSGTPLVQSGLVTDASGNFYGFASNGGFYNCQENNHTCGFIFRVGSDGKYSVLHMFRGGDDGGFPISLTIDKKGNLYGTTFNAPGTIFRVSPSGKKTTLYVSGSDGSPQSVTVGVDGNLYGTSL